MQRFKTIGSIVNQVAVEIGLVRQSDVFASNDPSFDQLTTLANSCGYELLQHEPWQQLTRTYQIVTQVTDTGKYTLPDDFAYITDQTGWERRENVPVTNLSPQEWTYLLGRDLVSYTIYASFRLNDGEMWIFPYADGSQPPPDGLDINFEYTSRNWVIPESNPTGYDDKVTANNDTVLFEPFMFERLLKTRFLEAKGFDSTKATEQFLLAFQSWSGKDKSAPILNMGRRGWGAPYLSTYGNTPDTGYGV